MTRLSDDWLSLPSIDLDPARAALVALITGGLLPPLAGFMTRATLDAIARRGRLPDGTPWLAPVVLPVPAAFARRASPGERFLLRDLEGAPVATLTAADVWETPAGEGHVGGAIEALGERHGLDNRSPASIRPVHPRGAVERTWTRTIALPVTLAVSALASAVAARRAGRDGGLLWLVCEPPSDDRRVPVHAVLDAVQTTREGMSTASRLVRCAVSLPDARASRLLLQATLARAYGATHLVVDGGADARLPDRTTLAAALREIGLEPVVVDHPAREDDEWLALFETGSPLPAGVLQPEVEAVLRRALPPRWARGLTVFFTGLSGSGKSTIATRLRTRLRESGRQVTLLDGDLVRRHLSSELGFSRAHRTINIERIAFVAAEIGRHGGTTICAPIAPYDATRRAARAMVEAAGGAFVLVHVDTPLAVCEARDRKGLYAKARAGLIPEFTGISDPYEPPADAEITIDTAALSPDAAVTRILEWLRAHRYLRLTG